MIGKLLELMNIVGIKPEEISDSLIRADEDNAYNFNSNFDKRLRLQKMVYLIQHKTGDFEYPFSLYLRGPYSSELAREYYRITEGSYSGTEPQLGIESREMAKTLLEKDNMWLEVASTIIMFLESYEQKDAISRAKEFKHDVLVASGQNESYVDRVFEEIKSIELI